MNPTNDNSDSSPSIPSASDEAALQAIEALEVEANDITDTEPIINTPAPLINEMLPPSRPIIQPPQPAVTPVVPETPVASAATEIPSIPQSPAALALSKSLQDDSVPYSSLTFQPFADQNKSSKKPVIIIVIILVLIGLGVGGYFGWQYLQNSKTPATVTPTTQTPDTTQTAPVITDTPESVSTEITNLTTSLDGIDDSEYNDSTLDDSTLLQ